MSDELEQARVRVKHLEAQAKLEQRLADAGTAYAADPSDENLTKHNALAEQLVTHRAQVRTVGGARVGGDAAQADLTNEAGE